MTETRTLHFENARQLQSLYANDLKLLKNMEDSLGVKVTTREGWVKIEGEPEKIDKAQQVFDQLEDAQKQGVPIQKHEFQYALNSVNEAREQTLTDIARTTRLRRGDPETRHRVWDRPGRHRQNLSRRRAGSSSAEKRPGRSDHFDQTGGGSGRGARVFAGRTGRKDHALFAAALRRAARYARTRGDRTPCRAANN